VHYVGLGGFGCRFSSHASNAGFRVLACVGSKGDLLRVSEGKTVEVAPDIGYNRDWRRASEELADHEKAMNTIRKCLEQHLDGPTLMAFGLGGAVGFALARPFLEDPPVPFVLLVTIPGESEDPQVRRNAREQVDVVLKVSSKLPILWVDNDIGGGYDRVNRMLEKTLSEFREFLNVPVEELPNMAGNYAVSPSLPGERVTEEIVKTNPSEIRRLVSDREPEERVIKEERKGPDPDSLRELF